MRQTQFVRSILSTTTCSPCRSRALSLTGTVHSSKLKQKILKLIKEDRKMPRLYVRDDDKDGCYFITLTARHWYYIFDRHDRWQILADSLIYCQNNKQLKIFAYVFMLNHLHLIVQSPDVSGFLRDFKSFTAHAILDNMKQKEPSVWALFKTDAEHRLWKEGNHPVLLETEHFFDQKITYIHNNPVRKGYINQPEHWKWSSANPHSTIVIDAP